VLASHLAQLPEEELAAMEDPVSQYMFGWSHGKEIMNGKKDFSKGSFYANPVYDQPTDDPGCIEAYPEYCHPNMWPKLLPELRDALRELGQLMLEVGKLIARECDGLLAKIQPDYTEGFLHDMISKTRCSKARLLHYFPKETSTTDTSEPQTMDSWCGWHLDHSCITALTSAMYIDESQPHPWTELTSILDTSSGLYIKNRGGLVMKVEIPRDCLAFQTGEALEIATSKHLRATPHCVRSTTKSNGIQRIARNTLALFIQPDWTQDLKPGYPFTKFTKEVLATHYDEQH
jgi:isopenicillin N synthase-like dioxygenase